jgi:sugar lactone lactonase YvrE
MLVTDALGNSLYRYDGITGAPIDNFVPRRTDMREPDLGLVVSPDQQYILVDGYYSKNVVRFNILDGSPAPANGQTGANFVPPRSGGLLGTEGIAFGSDGNLYVANDGLTYGNILKYDGNTGDFLGIFVDRGVGGMGRGNDLHWGPDGNLYVSLSVPGPDGAVLRYDSTGTPLGVDGSTTDATFIDVGPGSLCNGFGFGPDGNIYVAVDDISSTIGSVLRFNPDGTPNPADGQTGAIFVPAGSGGVRFMDGVGFGYDGNLYVTEPQAGRILEYDINDNNGAFLGAFVDSGSSGLQAPGTVLFYDDGTGPNVPHNNERAASIAIAVPHGGQQFVESETAMPLLGEPVPAPKGESGAQALVKPDGVSAAHYPTSMLLDVDTSLVPILSDVDLLA